MVDRRRSDAGGQNARRHVGQSSRWHATIKATRPTGVTAGADGDAEILAAAETTLPPANVATLDAIHLATAVRLAEAGLLDAVMTYDLRLAEGARAHGLAVLAPA